MFFLLGNRNQTSIAVDLKSKEGVEIIHKLLREYDVVIENFRAGVMEKLGLGYEDLKKINPGIIYCSCSGYGSSGPYVKKPGQDLLIQSMSGLVSLTGSDPEDVYKRQGEETVGYLERPKPDELLKITDSYAVQH